MRELLKALNNYGSIYKVKNINYMIGIFGLDRTEILLNTLNMEEIDELFIGYIDDSDFHEVVERHKTFNVNAESILEHKLNHSFLFTLKNLDNDGDGHQITDSVIIQRHDDTLESNFNVYDYNNKEGYRYVRFNDKIRFSMKVELMNEQLHYNYDDTLNMVIGLCEYIRNGGNV